MSRYELVLVGGGNMGAALLTGLIETATVDAADLAVVELLEQRRADLADRFPGVAVSGEIPPCEAAVIATKPDGAAAATRDAVAAGALRVLSIAAGVTTATLDDAAGADVAVVRAMPNIAAIVGQGSAAVTGGAHAGDHDLAWAETVLGAVGGVDRLAESFFDAFTALAGSGPAYLFAVAEYLIDAGAAAGLQTALTHDVVRRLFAGAAAMLAGDADPVVLREMVTSPGGTTAAGIAVLDERDVRSAFVDAVTAAAARSAELGC